MSQADAPAGGLRRSRCAAHFRRIRGAPGRGSRASAPRRPARRCGGRASPRAADGASHLPEGAKLVCQNSIYRSDDAAGPSPAGKTQAGAGRGGEKTVEANSGGGMVRAVVDGSMRVRRIDIDPSLLAANDKAMIEDLIVVAVNDGLAPRAGNGRRGDAQARADGRHRYFHYLRRQSVGRTQRLNRINRRRWRRISSAMTACRPR